MRDWKKQIADSKERFLSDTDKHEMTVLHDDGLYRHVRFKEPSTGFYWFDLVTWPGYLSITGDMGAYTFARVQDMFTFFYGSSINPGYWGEKVVAGEVNAYSEDTFREWVDEEIANARDDKPDLNWTLIINDVDSDVLEEASHQESAVNAVHYWNDVYSKSVGFKFYTDEGLDFTDFTHRFLWCCHAIQWGIEQYNAAKAVGIDS
jgi:hypothetical protein